MAMQAGFGLSRIAIMAGAGYTGTILIKNGKMADFIRELQAMFNGKGGDEFDDSDMGAQLRRLAQEMRAMASTKQITYINGGSGTIGNLTPLILPTTFLGAVGYAYMRWKGIKLSDLMYVTKRSMATAVTNLTNHLESVSDSLSATKKHLTQRIQNLDGKMDEQRDLSKLIINNVNDVQDNIGTIERELGSLNELVYGLDWKIDELGENQADTNEGVLYLCKVINGEEAEKPKLLQLQGARRPRKRLIALEGLKEIIISTRVTQIAALPSVPRSGTCDPDRGEFAYQIGDFDVPVHICHLLRF